ncbi:hypothetical protein BJ508DRAFT_324860 [Ascobolus immersus RN42]|uniref:Uncharacterized protein n=1 Tax=Ascobolus immersus RN42 TaxID=1160509 RepID=A0A3N4IFN4_ASCIM|nr:hypothetical protein BJ508DRAFT_324860 [Ascobolus immersus RN42]
MRRRKEQALNAEVGERHTVAPPSKPNRDQGDPPNDPRDTLMNRSFVPATSQPSWGRVVGLFDAIPAPAEGTKDRKKRETIPAVVASFTQNTNIGEFLGNDPRHYPKYSTTPESPVQAQQHRKGEGLEEKGEPTKIQKDDTLQNAINSERRYRHDGDHPEKEELFHEEGQPQANHQHDSGTQSLQKRERKRVISEELYHREDGIRKKGRGREEGYNNHVKDNTAEAVSTTSTDVDEEGSDDFENTYFTPEENKHPDDFLDEDEIDPDFEPLESPSEPDEEEFEEKYSDSDAVGYVGKNEKTERNSRHTDRSTNDGLEYDSDRESSYQPSMHMENTTGGIYQRDIQTIRKACFYIHEDHEGTQFTD